MSFNSLEIAKTGLFISQKAIDVTGHNIANANSTGYTRQRLVTEAIDPASYTTRLSIIEKGAVGDGTRVQILDQIRNTYLDREIRRENASLGQWETRAEEMEFVELLLNETSDSSISMAIADFFNSVNELSLDPINEEIRTNVQQNALKLTETFNHYYNQFSTLQDKQNDNLKATADRINDMLTNITSYNKKIYSFELGGESANDMRDQRNVLLDELSKLVNIEYSENSDDHLILTVEGVEMINHIDATLLEASPDLTGAVSGNPDYYEIYYEGTATPFAYSDGELQAYKSLRDGSTIDTFGIPLIMENLNTLARSVAREFNAIHNTGYTVPDGGVASRNNVDFFDVPLGDYNLVTAKSMSLSADIMSSVFNIAASDTLIDLSASNNMQGNNKIALELVALSSRTDLTDISNFENFLKSTIVEVAIESEHCLKMSESQKVISKNLENRRQSISGVSVDEEMIMMIKYQHSYAASARVITAIDEALDILINRTGLVGR